MLEISDTSSNNKPENPNMGFFEYKKKSYFRNRPAKTADVTNAILLISKTLKETYDDPKDEKFEYIKTMVHNSIIDHVEPVEEYRKAGLKCKYILTAKNPKNKVRKSINICKVHTKDHISKWKKDNQEYEFVPSMINMRIVIGTILLRGMYSGNWSNLNYTDTKKIYEKSGLETLMQIIVNDVNKNSFD
jgi:hypothetical protein